MYLDYFLYTVYVIVTLFVIYIFIKKQSYIRANKDNVFYFILALLLYTQYRRYGARFFSGTFDFAIDSLPIHFCRMSAFMTLIYLITKNKVVKGFVYFQSGLGFLSVLIPGGYFFIMTFDWRSITYMWDHFILAIMPVFLVLIMDYNPTKRDFIISLLYSIFVPLLVLPIAIQTNYNAYYVLDGVFAKDIVGNNQFLISSLMLVALVIYNILMWYVGKYLVSLRKETTEPLLSPKTPWIVLSTYFIVGTIISFFYFGPTPTPIKTLPDAYLKRPTEQIREDILIYSTIDDDGLYYYIELTLGDKLTVYTPNDNQLTPLGSTNDYLFIKASDIVDDTLTFEIESGSNPTYEYFSTTLITDTEEFLDNYHQKLIHNND